MDPAATEFFKDGVYRYEGERTARDRPRCRLSRRFADKYPIVSIEDGMSEDDWEGWKALTEAIGDRCQLVGDDLFVTNTERLRRESARHRQLDPHQAQPDRHAHRDLRGVAMAKTGLHRGRLPPFRRDRGFDHRRFRRRHQLRPDQNRLPVAFRAAGEIQPAPAYRGTAWSSRPLRRALGPSRLIQGARSPVRATRSASITLD